jgi:23S rRNA (cytosine1962-C5)-methyltransferase
MNIKLELAGTKRLAAGHPWVRREDLSRFAQPPTAGALVRLQDSMGNFLGHAVSDGPSSAIPYRVLSRSRHPQFDAAYFAGCVERALGKRPSLAKEAKAPKDELRRLIHGEADELPGVFCDRVGSSLLLQYSSPGMLAFSSFIEDALLAQAKSRVLWRKSFGPWQNVHGRAEQRSFSAWRAGLKFMVRLDDPEEPYDFEPEAAADFERLSELGPGAEALCVFSRRGAWPAALGLSGAKKVLCLERDPAQVALAQENLELNHFTGCAFEMEAGDAFSRLDRLKEKRQFNSVMVDAPTQSKTTHGRFNAAKQLPGLAARALALVESGGWAAFSLKCGLISPATFQGAISQGAREAGVGLESLALRRFPKDMPVLEGFAEGQGRLWQAWKVIKP